MPPSPAALKKLPLASAVGVALAGERASPKDGLWLVGHNPYRSEVVEKLRKDPQNVQAKRLGEYIAASIPSHCFDGWAYLGRAIQALLRGDAGTARHLGYYAELRAALCILAHQGIAVLDREHFVVDVNGEAHPLEWSDGTHVVAADLLEWWSKQASSAAFLGSVIRPAQESLLDWIEQFPLGVSIETVAEQRFAEWKIDLAQLARDRRARNDASYRPRHVVPNRLLHPRRAARFVEAIWELIEPTGPRYFERLDRWLLRLTLEHLYSGIYEVSHPIERRRYRHMVKETVDNVVGSAQLRPAITNDLLSRVGPVPFVLSQSGGGAKPGSPSYELQVLSRATLLLRLAAGAMRDLASEAGISDSSMTAWWGRIGSDFSLWAAVPTTPTDLWADVEPALKRLASWRATEPSGYVSLRVACGAEQVTLSQTELAPVWALG